MSDEDRRVRTEPPTEEHEKTGFFRPLPDSRPSGKVERGVPMVKFLGMTMAEQTRDRVILLMIPLLVALIDASIYVSITVQTLEEGLLYTFAIPALAAITIGLLSRDSGYALVGAFLCAVFFFIIMVISMTWPGLVIPGETPLGYMLTSVAVSGAYLILVIFASVVGTSLGLILREFL
ncbi:MAG: hypothetical protein QXS20_03220 [Candidatus Thorarchaeota archaeon]